MSAVGAVRARLAADPTFDAVHATAAPQGLAPPFVLVTGRGGSPAGRGMGGNWNLLDSLVLVTVVGTSPEAISVMAEAVVTSLDSEAWTGAGTTVVWAEVTETDDEDVAPQVRGLTTDLAFRIVTERA